MFREYKRLVKSDASDQKRRELAERVCDALTVHAQIEEEIFYPAAREVGIKRDLMDEAEVEHQSAKSLIGQIKSMTPADRTYDAKVTVLSEFIDHHVEEEESQMFPLCRRSSMNLRGARRGNGGPQSRACQVRERHHPRRQEGNRRVASGVMHSREVSRYEVDEPKHREEYSMNSELPSSSDALGAMPTTSSAAYAVRSPTADKVRPLREQRYAVGGLADCLLRCACHCFGVGGTRPGLPLFRGLAACDQHRNNHRHLLDGLSDSTKPEQGQRCGAPEAERTAGLTPKCQQPHDRH